MNKLIIIDDFAFLDVTDKAKEIFNSGLFELFRLEEDDTEASINTIDELNDDLDHGYRIVIEGGKIQNH